MPIISVGPWEELQVSEFEELVWTGKIDAVQMAIQSGKNIESENAAVWLAIRSRNLALTQLLLQNRAPVSDNCYGEALRSMPEIIDNLPPRPELLQKLRPIWVNRQLRYHLENDKATLSEIKDLIEQGADINTLEFTNHSFQLHTPLHLAARYPRIEILEFLLKNGANALALNAEKKNAFRMILENFDITRQERRKIYQLFSSYKVRPEPELSRTENFFAKFGWRVHRSP